MSEPGFISHRIQANGWPIGIVRVFNVRITPSIGCGGGFQPVGA
jgi:hypothetical protein